MSKKERKGNKRIKKNRMIIFIAIVLVIAVGAFFIIKNVKLPVGKNNTESSETEEEKPNIHLKSTKTKPIEKDGIEATDIKMTFYADEIQVRTTLKNNTKEKIDSIMIQIEFYNDKDELVTTISSDTEGALEPKQTTELLNYIIGIENPEQIKSAKISSLEKNNIQGFMDETFEEMESY